MLFSPLNHTALSICIIQWNAENEQLLFWKSEACTFLGIQSSSTATTMTIRNRRILPPHFHFKGGYTEIQLFLKANFIKKILFFTYIYVFCQQSLFLYQRLFFHWYSIFKKISILAENFSYASIALYFWHICNPIT